jgi:hypothetical protein
MVSLSQGTVHHQAWCAWCKVPLQRWEMGWIKTWPLCDKCKASELASSNCPFAEGKPKRSTSRVSDLGKQQKPEMLAAIQAIDDANPPATLEPIAITINRLAREFEMHPKQLKCFASEIGIPDATKWTAACQLGHITVVRLRRAHRELTTKESAFFYVPRSYLVGAKERDILRSFGWRMCNLSKRTVEPQNPREHEFVAAINDPSSRQSELAAVWSRFVDWCER